jgi:hypothetical protein
LTVRRIDHLVYAAPGLEQGVERLQELTGFEVTPGGRHPQWGTRNALVVLDNETYLEVIAPDPRKSPGRRVTLFGIESLTSPRLVTWAARASDLESLRDHGRVGGLDLGPVSGGSRTQPGGTVLSWRLTDPEADRLGGVVPFFIDWGTSLHPTATLDPQGRLVGLRAVHPAATRTDRLIRHLGLELPVREGAEPRLVACLETPRGTVELI